MVDLEQACRDAEHPDSVSIGQGWRRCQFCGDEFKRRYQKRPTDRPNIVNGYYLSNADYELVKGFRRARDFTIDKARGDYQAKVTALLAYIKASEATNG